VFFASFVSFVSVFASSFASEAFAGVVVSGVVGVAAVVSEGVSLVLSVLSEGCVEGCGVCGGVVACGAGVVGVAGGAAGVFAGAWAVAATERLSKAAKPRCVRVRMGVSWWAASLLARAQLNMLLT
jgi:hypothetical protein